MSARGRSFGGHEGGATAVEFAIVVPFFLALLVGVIQCALLVFTISSLGFATESAARCASVSATQCPDASTTSSYAKSVYYANGNTPNFTVATAACGNSVTGTVAYDFNVVIYSTSLQLSSSACFP